MQTLTDAPLFDPALDRAPAPSRLPGRRHLAMAAFAFIAILGVALAARHWWTYSRFIESTDDAYIGGDVTSIAPEVSAFISQVAITDNQRVHVGDLLIKLDDHDYRAALDKAEAAVAIHQAALTNFDALRRLQESVVAQAQAEIAASDAETSRATDDLARYQKLSANGAASLQAFQKAQAEYKESLAGGEKTRAALAASRRQLDVIDTQKLQAQAELTQSVAERHIARLNLGYTELRAPIDGIVGNRSARVGAFASAGSQLICLVPTSGLWIDANFKESQLKRIKPGEPVEVIVDSVAGHSFHGHVVSLAPATGAQFSVLPPENATGNFTKIVQRVPARILLDDNQKDLDQLRPGLSVTAEVDGHPRP